MDTLPLVSELRLALGGAGETLSGILLLRGQLVTHAGADVLYPRRADPELGVEVGDALLDLLQSGGLQRSAHHMR
jgi:hypothetical protein